MPDTPWLGWHFLSKDRRLRGGSREIVRAGRTLDFAGRPKLHVHGFHASRQVIDALIYAPGPIVERVELGGTIVTGTGVAVAQTRTTLWMADVTRILHEFTSDVVEDLLINAQVNDRRSLDSIDMKRKWLANEVTDEELRAAKWAAKDAIQDDANYIEQIAAWTASWTSASDAAATVARLTVGDAARGTYNTMLEARLFQLVP